MKTTRFLSISLAFFGLVLAARAVPVTFQVNMSIQKKLGNFDPAAHLLEVRGGFNAWAAGATMTPSTSDPNIFTYIYDATEGAETVLQYKFVINTPNADGTFAQVWEGNVGVGMQNRAVTLQDTDQLIPVAFFNNLSVDPGTGVAVTFRVNMALAIANGTFVPGTDIVQVRGGFYNNWGPGLVAQPDPKSPSVYAATYSIKSLAPGASVPHKFTINDGGWEGGADRVFVLESGPQVLPVVFYNRVEPVAPGPIALSAAAGGKINVTWTALAGVTLQTTSDLGSGVWTEVPNTDGLGSYEFTISSSPKFFRLASLSVP